MQLKELSGNADLFDAMKGLEKQQKIMLKKSEERDKQRKKKQSLGVFGFLNKGLASSEKGEWTFCCLFCVMCI